MNAFQSKDPANNKKLAGAFSEIFYKLLQKTEGQLPAEIVSYNRRTNVAKVKILVSLLTTTGQPVKRPQIAKVPVLALGGGGFFIGFPLVAGNKGWIEASDRDISLFMQSGQNESQPNTTRLHNFSDGRFIPDVFGEYTISDDDAGAMVIQSLDGTVKIALDADSVRISHDAVSVTIADSGIALAGPRIDLNGTLFINGVQYTLHHHGGVTTGLSNTGGVTP